MTSAEPTQTSRPATTVRTEDLQVYLLGFGWDWLLFLYIRFGLKRRSVRTVRQVLDDRDWTFVRCLLYFAIAVGLVFFWGTLGFAPGRFLNIDLKQGAGIRSLFPSSLLAKPLDGPVNNCGIL
jgi:hypothetical protein